MNAMIDISYKYCSNIFVRNIDTPLYLSNSIYILINRFEHTKFLVYYTILALLYYTVL